MRDVTHSLARSREALRVKKIHVLDRSGESFQRPFNVIVYIIRTQTFRNRTTFVQDCKVYFIITSTRVQVCVVVPFYACTDIKTCQTKIKQTKSPAKTLQIKPQIKRLQSNINEHLWYLFITSNNKAKCIRPWVPILVFSLLNFQDFNHVFHCSLRSTAWKPSVVLLPFHRRITQAAPSISSPKTARILYPNHRRNERFTSLSQTTRIEL